MNTKKQLMFLFMLCSITATKLLSASLPAPTQCRQTLFKSIASSCAIASPTQTGTPSAADMPIVRDSSSRPSPYSIPPSPFAGERLSTISPENVDYSSNEFKKYYEGYYEEKIDPEIFDNSSNIRLTITTQPINMTQCPENEKKVVAFFNQMKIFYSKENEVNTGTLDISALCLPDIQIRGYSHINKKITHRSIAPIGTLKHKNPALTFKLDIERQENCSLSEWRLLGAHLTDDMAILLPQVKTEHEQIESIFKNVKKQQILERISCQSGFSQKSIL